MVTVEIQDADVPLLAGVLRDIIANRLWQHDLIHSSAAETKLNSLEMEAARRLLTQLVGEWAQRDG